MDLIYMNAKREDVGVLLRYDLDLSFGANENNFECTVNKAEHCCEAGYYLYMDGTEYGGMIDAVKSDTSTGDVTYSGRTWHGLLESKILEPDAGQDYLVLDGEANAVLASLLQRVGLGSLFVASTAASGVTIKNYQMNRYIGAYSGIRKMLKDAGAKLLFTFTDGKVVLSATPVVDYTDGLDADIIDFSAKRVQGKVNHLICLGQGELSQRTVVHLYADADGNISQEQTFSGVDEYATVYDYSSAESAETLITEGTKRLQELRAQDALSVAFTQTDSVFDVGDIVGAYDGTTDVSVSVAIAQKIVTVKDGLLTVSYSTDTQNTSVSVGSSTGESGGGQSGGSDVAKDSEMLGGKAPAYYLPAYNLLDNSDFCNPVNQRGITSGATVDKWAYSIDRWKNMSSNAATITLSSAGLQSTQTIAQYIGNVGALLGKTCTAAACWADGTVLVATGAISRSAKYTTLAASETVNGHQVMIVDNGDSTAVTMRVLGSADSPVVWAALYEGAYTADTLPPYMPKGYAVELSECRRYFVRDVAVCTMGTQYTSANGLIAIHIPRMRVNPTITLRSASDQGWGTIELSKFSAGWSSTYGSGYTMNYVYSGTADTRSQFVGVTFTLQFEASADL